MFGKKEEKKEDKKMGKSIDEMTEEEIEQYLTSRKVWTIKRIIENPTH